MKRVIKCSLCNADWFSNVCNTRFLKPILTEKQLSFFNEPVSNGISFILFKSFRHNNHLFHEYMNIIILYSYQYNSFLNFLKGLLLYKFSLWLLKNKGA